MAPNRPDTSRLFDINKVFKALADPIRRRIVGELLRDKRGSERHCSTFGLTVTKATRSHHFKTLREAGLISVVDKGNYAVAVLRWDEIEAGLPGLMELLQHTLEPIAAESV
ncbi:ArsR/SmtB family transcription factor [Biostraticola tofi]|uniref:ArsR family transcriptional regulator n=1 Tax=Biostraticola tofi TaxID=466109 RepID=A0A4R3Z3Q3_9GAMM|nr:helix-turn-helix domain-containing protein [Biostraticola tofi]TCV98933.1 ArsR family transcriptional regulator [Biostraticola tofi]